MTSVVALLQAKIRSSGATVEQRCDEELQAIGVFGELRQVLANLLLNSLHACWPGTVGLSCVLRPPLTPTMGDVASG